MKSRAIKKNIDMITKEYGSLENYREYCLTKYNEIDVNQFLILGRVRFQNY